MVDQNTITDKIEASLEDDERLPCPKAFAIARKLDVEPLEVGDVATSLDISVSRCQLGLFGHGPREEGKGRAVRAGMAVGEELAARIRSALVKGKLPCADAWEIASEFKLTRLELGNAAETLGLRVSPCQLGFF
jgi:hypothetical protein